MTKDDFISTKKNWRITLPIERLEFYDQNFNFGRSECVDDDEPKMELPSKESYRDINSHTILPPLDKILIRHYLCYTEKKIAMATQLYETRHLPMARSSVVGQNTLKRNKSCTLNPLSAMMLSPESQISNNLLRSTICLSLTEPAYALEQYVMRPPGNNVAFLNDDRIEEELQLLFGLPDDPEVSEDEYETEPETVTDLGISNILNGIDDPMLRSEVDAQCQNYDSVPLNNLNTEEPSTSSAGDQPLPSSLHLDSNTESSSPIVLPLRHDSVLMSSPTPPVANAATMSDTDESDTEEQEWKKVLYPQLPDIDYFDSIHLEHTNFIPSRTRPVTYFTHFFDTDVIDLLVEQTNIYAEQSRSHGWSPVDIPEMKAFLGTIILMGLHPLPTIDLYRSSDPFFRIAGIASVMTCKRFKKVLENLHLNDNSKMPPREALQFDKLYKVRSILELLNTACQRSAKTTTSQSIDESMIQFKGISSLKQYMPLKPVKRGYKVWIRADSETGYVFKFQIYTGKRDDQIRETDTESRYFFASYDILQYLYNNGIYATATVNSNRADLPLVVKHAKKKNIPRSQKINLARGELRWRTKNNVAFVM
ncbi:unnamed protein product [Parnassius apollo]|uniref:(apollo) hypothetical protein n=1 Tax=Parnassius apollo TaxID=110799 RepID=A0A8S3WEC0_PARAO|nr:unnamed protein product [Parnassius apollo]